MYTAEPVGGPVLFAPGPHPPFISYVNPPPLAAALRPLASLGWPAFARVWLGLTAVGLVLFAAICARAWTGRYALRPTLTALAVLFLMPPVLIAWQMQNVDVWVWVLVGIGVVHLSGAALAGAAFVKVVGVYVLPVLLWRNPRSWIGAAAITLLVAEIGLLSLGAEGSVLEWRIWLTRIAPVLGQGEFWPDATLVLDAGGRQVEAMRAPANLSLPLLPLQLLHGAGRLDVSGPLPLPARLWLTGMAFGMPLLAAILSRRQSVVGQITVVLTAALLSAPVLRLTYLPMLVPCVLVWWRTSPRAASQVAASPARSPS
jgi:hypothetical protein